MIVIIGKSGQLARACAALCEAEQQSYRCFGRDDIDLLDSTDITSKLASLRNIQGIINTAAYTAVDKAEEEREAAFALNAQAVVNLVDFCRRQALYFVHISTDYVFSGEALSPYLPTTSYAPINVYGKSKMAGEKAVIEAYSENSCVLRTSWVYSEFGHNFVKTMLRLFATRSELNVVMDQVGAPTSAHTLARVCLQSVKQRLSGVHHACDLGVTSWFDFAIAIYQQAHRLGLVSQPVQINPITSDQFPTPAKRPHYSVLSTESLRRALTIEKLPHWQVALTDVMNKINDKIKNTENDR